VELAGGMAGAAGGRLTAKLRIRLRDGAWSVTMKKRTIRLVR
jgi:hypothetical protein